MLQWKKCIEPKIRVTKSVGETQRCSVEKRIGAKKIGIEKFAGEGGRRSRRKDRTGTNYNGYFCFYIKVVEKLTYERRRRR